MSTEHPNGPGGGGDDPETERAPGEAGSDLPAHFDRPVRVESYIYLPSLAYFREHLNLGRDVNLETQFTRIYDETCEIDLTDLFRPPAAEMPDEVWGVFWSPSQGQWDIDELSNTAQKSRAALWYNPSWESDWVFVGHTATWEAAHALRKALMANGIGR